MKPKINIITVILLLFLLVILASCFTTFKNPLSSPDNASIDEELLGLWKLEDKEVDESSYVLILEGEKKQMQFLLFSDKFIFEEGYSGFPTNLGDKKFLNIQSLNIKESDHITDINEEYIIVYYEIKKKTLTINLLKNDLFADSVEKGILNGKLTKDTKSAYITDSTDILINFFNSHDKSEYLNEEGKMIMKKTKI